MSYYKRHVLFCCNWRESPEACSDTTWYADVDKHDVDEIIDSHVVHGRMADRLEI